MRTQKSVFDPIVKGYFKINFSNIKEYYNNCNIEYLVRSITTNKPTKLIHHNSGDIIPFPNGSIVEIEGVLDNKYIKDRETGKWIDKGNYIDITGFKVLTENEIESLYMQIDIEKHNMNLEGNK